MASPSQKSTASTGFKASVISKETKTDKATNDKKLNLQTIQKKLLIVNSDLMK